MERGRNGRDDFFGAGDPFAGFSGGFGRPGSLIPGLFGGRDPFDDPFFTQPFGGRMGGPGNMFGPSLFQPMGMPRFGDGFLEQAPARSNNSGRPIITEMDDEEGENGQNEQPNHEAHVQEPHDGNDGMQGGQVQVRRDFDRASGSQPQAHSFSYQSSSVTYGGVNGAYYTASKTRRSGSDGITVEESKEADTTTKEATHRISRGIHDKGHSLTRKLKSDGKVDSTQILHNLNEDELPGFEESWKGNAGLQLPGWNQNAGISNDDSSGVRGARQTAQSWALPGTQQVRDHPRSREGRPKSQVIPIS